MGFLGTMVLVMYIITDSIFGCLFLTILERCSRILRKKTYKEILALCGTGWMFVLYLVNIVLMVLARE